MTRLIWYNHPIFYPPTRKLSAHRAHWRDPPPGSISLFSVGFRALPPLGGGRGVARYSYIIWRKSCTPRPPAADSPQHVQPWEIVLFIVVIYREEYFEYLPPWKHPIDSLSLQCSMVPVPCLWPIVSIPPGVGPLSLSLAHEWGCVIPPKPLHPSHFPHPT